MQAAYRPGVKVAYCSAMARLVACCCIAAAAHFDLRYGCLAAALPPTIFVDSCKWQGLTPLFFLHDVEIHHHTVVFMFQVMAMQDVVGGDAEPQRDLDGLIAPD